jgi:predicted AlkP superfamily phosphohydrolase/phosphomutase
MHGNQKDLLVEIPKVSTSLRGGIQKEPKFERDNLEGQSSGNHLKENPEVLSRLSHRAGSKETLFQLQTAQPGWG